MAKHHFRAGFGRQPLPIQEGAIPLEKKSAPNLRDTLDGNYMKLHLHIYMCGLCQQGSHFNLEAKER